MEEPIVSVIVPVYNVEKYLKRCIDSIINQTYKNLEIILVDDGSPDNCGKICDDYAKVDSRIKVIHKENGGVSSARNVGIEKATGEFVAFVDSDDYINKEMYYELVKKQKETGSDLVFSRYKIVRKNYIENIKEMALETLCENNDVSVFLNFSTKTEKKEEVNIIHNYVMGSICRVLFRNTIIKKYRFNTKLKIMEDCAFLLNLILNENCKLSYVDDYFYNYYCVESGVVHTANVNVLENCKNLVKEYEKILLGTKYEKSLQGLKFFCYSQSLLQKYSENVNIDLKEIKDWNTKQNYKALNKSIMSFKGKIKYFCVRHKLNFILKLLLNLHKKHN